MGAKGHGWQHSQTQLAGKWGEADSHNLCFPRATAEHYPQRWQKKDFNFIFLLNKFPKLTVETARKSVSSIITAALQLSSYQVKQASCQSQRVHENLSKVIRKVYIMVIFYCLCDHLRNSFYTVMISTETVMGSVHIPAFSGCQPSSGQPLSPFSQPLSFA